MLPVIRLIDMSSDRVQAAIAAFKAGDYRRVRTLCRKVLKRQSGRPDMLELLGLAELRLGRPQQAEPWLHKLIAARPTDPVAHYNLGLARYRGGDPQAALPLFERALAITPDLAPCWSDMALALKDCRRYEEAVAAISQACRLAPDVAGFHNNAGVIHQAYGLLERAYDHYRRAVELDASNPVYLKNLGLAHLGYGKREQAEAVFRKALMFQPEYGEAWRHLVFTHCYDSVQHEDIRRLEALRQRENLPATTRVDILFALGKAYDDCGEYESAFVCFQEGNASESARLGFDPGRLRSRYRDSAEVFKARNLPPAAPVSGPSAYPEPVFIVGLPRSGTSLLEGLLAGHSLICAGGERYWFNDLEQRLPSLTAGHQPYPWCLRDMGEDLLNELAGEYRKHLASISDGSPYVIDKLPANFERLGLIRMLFPTAPIIHCERNPMDVCWSLYTQRFPDALHYAYDFQHLAQYVEYHRDIMALWHECYPGVILDVGYESLIEEPRDTLRALCGFIGVAWEESCMMGSNARRWVNTASDYQVHGGVRSNTGGRWQPYMHYLSGLHADLARVGGWPGCVSP
ncbi:MAG: hypothetical protein CMN57_00295 [Gammaproteobacteria bacterium]|nr:hypothetical protein [Gammaproteobacteria bacterium]